jgi:hypothetical protein
MTRMSREEEAKLATEFERDAENDELWEEVPASTAPSSRRTLGTQVTIRLDGKSAEQLREIARHQGVGYTSLLRSWVEERLNAEISTVRADRPQITDAGSSGTWTLFKRSFQLSGSARVVTRVD